MIGPSSFLQITRIAIKACVSLSFCQTPPLTAELAALECLKNHSSASIFDWIIPFLEVTRFTIKSGLSSNYYQIGLLTVELAAYERLEKSQYTSNGGNVVTTLVPSFLNGSSSFFQVTRTTIKARMTLLFFQIQQLTTELAALECLK